MGYLVKLMQKKWKWRYAIAAVLLLFVLWLSMLLTDGTVCSACRNRPCLPRVQAQGFI